MRKPWAILSILLFAVALAACTPEVGTRKWCEHMEDKPKGDWSANDATAYAKHCVLNTYKDDED